ncbi:MAG: hypothetical protein VB056_06820 [Sphaerochaeta associata]|uniref:hypothetical protein n=1 Tax=Sphaerochaeta associata TaxID=1129264 RepID=UPI002B20FC5C|nr:hypothetical protein [Sphaerochaeta associata]MEA5028578.1 hypothetical protein [Sphaerochaeta associata]
MWFHLFGDDDDDEYDDEYEDDENDDIDDSDYYDDDDEDEDEDEYFGYSFEELDEEDGIIDGDSYWSDDDYQIAWVLKEPYFSDETIPIREILGYRPVNNRTIQRVAFATYGIHYDTYFEDIPNINQDSDVADELQTVAWININKEGGNTTSQYWKLKQAYNNNRYLLLGQLQAYEPEIVIFGGTFNLFWHDLIGELGLTLQKLDFTDVDDACDCYVDGSDSSVLYIEAEHPGVRSDTGEYVDSIISAVRAWESGEYSLLDEW